MINLSEKVDGFMEKLKEKQVKAQKQKNTKLIIGISCGVIGLSLVGLVIWLKNSLQPFKHIVLNLLSPWMLKIIQLTTR